ncbi:MAG: DUF1800 family protein, partial [Ignavibacteriota bacterium]
AHIKSPNDHMVGLLRTFDLSIDEMAATTAVFHAYSGSQVLLDPPNVKGWPGYHTWLSTTTLPYRNSFIQTALIGGSLTGGNLPIDFTNAQLTTWAKQFKNYGGEFEDMVKEMATFLCAQPPSAKALKHVIDSKAFPPNIYEWSTLSDTNKLSPLRVMAREIMLLADFQLS